MTPLTLLFVEWVFINFGLLRSSGEFFGNLLIWSGKEKDGRQDGVGHEHRDDRHDHRAGR